MTSPEESWDLLQGIATVECPACGAEAARTDEACPACGAALPREDEAETPLSLMVGGEARGTTARERKIPLDEAKNLLKLREARDGALSGAMADDDYRALVEEVLQVAWTGTELFKTPAVKSRVAGLPPDQAELVTRTHQEMFHLHAAVSKMAAWIDTRDPADAETGFQEAQAAYERLDAIQDQALDKSEQFYGE